MNYQEENSYDELRARFTKWMEVTLYRAKVNYKKAQKRKNKDVFIDDVMSEITSVSYAKEDTFSEVIRQDSFYFDNDSVNNSFDSLTAVEQRILTELFLYNKDIKEISEELGYSLSHTYRLKDDALSNMRKMLGGNE